MKTLSIVITVAEMASVNMVLTRAVQLNLPLEYKLSNGSNGNVSMELICPESSSAPEWVQKAEQIKSEVEGAQNLFDISLLSAAERAGITTGSVAVEGSYAGQS